MTGLILQTKDSASGSEYEVYIVSQEIGYYRSYGTISLSNATKSNFLESFKQIEDTGKSLDMIDDDVKNIGLQLYKEIIPPDLDKIYWELRPNIKSIHIWSMEPWIPWEIIKPSRKSENGDIQEDEFLCERYALCRWQIGIRPRVKQEVRKVKVIVPFDTKLKGVLEERDWIKEFATSKGLNVSFASSYREVMSTLTSGDYDLIHFSTHGKHNIDAPVLSEIELENGAKLKPVAINGRAQNFGQSHPLVILNACQSGVLDFSFTAIQGWATKFLEAGASAFICTLWSVTDEIALKFTKVLYDQLFKGIPLGEAVKISRRECIKSGDPSWLAYQVYGHPNLKIEPKLTQ